MSNDCYCFGPPVDDCPVHGNKRPDLVVADDPKYKIESGSIEDFEKFRGLVLPYGWTFEVR
ncbi:MAG: hypothetical protein ACW99U_20955 [Candidatus Thorarchaeota archaeon]|jgi:hypothetical protein